MRAIGGAFGLCLVLAVVSVASAGVQIGVSNPPNLDNLYLGVGQETSFEIGVQNYPESENSLRFEIENLGLPLSFSDNEFILAPGTSKQVTVTVFPITQEGVYNGEISVSVYSLEVSGVTPIIPVTGIPVNITVGENIPPAAPTLVSPENNTIENTLTVTFTWKQPGSGMRYHIQIDDEASFTSPYVHENTAVVENSYTHTFGESNEYHWRVRARDNVGNWSAWSESFKFTIVLEEPAKLPIVPLILVICVIAAGISLMILKLKSKHGMPSSST
jgi:hypothetical protein